MLMWLLFAILRWLVGFLECPVKVILVTTVFTVKPLTASVVSLSINPWPYSVMQEPS